MKFLPKNLIEILAGKIQISNSTNMMLEVVGGYKTEERGTIDIKVRKKRRRHVRMKCFLILVEEYSPSASFVSGYIFRIGHDKLG